jgi:hypothetical protein
LFASTRPAIAAFDLVQILIHATARFRIFLHAELYPRP